VFSAPPAVAVRSAADVASYIRKVSRREGGAMGAYIYAGVITELDIERKIADRNGPRQKWDAMRGSFTAHLDFSLFLIEEKKDSVNLKIRPDLFELHIHDFLREQYSLIYKPDDRSADDALSRIAGLDYNGMMEAASESAPFYFQKLDSEGRAYTCLTREHYIYYEMIMYFMVGKAFVEESCALCSYMAALIRRSTGNPLGGAVLVDLI
jgi:hypothetical protein